MKITDLLDVRGIDLNGEVSSKQQAIEKMVDLMAATGRLSDKKAYRNGVFAREEEGTTGIGEGIAIPHAKSDAVKAPGLCAMVIKNGVDFESLDGEPVHLIFLIAAPNTKDNVHLDVLSKLSALLMDESFTEGLKHASTVEEFLGIINEAEAEKNQEQQHAHEQRAGQYKILAVTACPTGIAHTYMAAESIEKKAKQAGVWVKVETNGSGGAKNVLTKTEIEEADCIIIAADTKVEMSRFNGKKVIITKVADGIHKAEELINRAISGDVPVYHDSNAKNESFQTEGKDSFGHVIYKHLMSGVSNMLPFVVGGGILIALAFLLDDYSINSENFGMNTPVAAFFKTTGDLAFDFMLPILAGFIAMSIADRPGLAVGFVGGAIANAGGSGFLGALVAGFAAGCLVTVLRKLFDKLPASLEGIKPVLLYPFFGVLLIGLGMVYLINPPVAMFNTFLNEVLAGMGNSSKMVLGFVLGGMMAIDFGGPLNKAAYVFGTASIASGQFDIMAAVMMGGMVPPLAIALATVVFPKKFTKSERGSGVTNFIMGLSFITEGAIPFAAADPLHVIPACAIGSAVAGSLSMMFGCTLQAPHGGIFVFPVVGKPIMYFAALIVGTVIGGVLLGLIKKTAVEV